MAFCKICDCGEKIVFARRLAFPDSCPSCGRSLIPFATYLEDDPAVERLIAAAKQPQSAPEAAPQPTAASACRYVLAMPDGSRIPIPPEGCVVGRTETGAGQLYGFSSVSRRHLQILPRRNAGVILIDLSTYGTFLDGKRLDKNVPVRAERGAVIRLCNTDVTLLAEEE